MAERHLVVTGMMGAGKTSVAEALSRRLRLPMRDSDHDIERLTGRTGAEFGADGLVDELHRLEEGVLLGALALERTHVIAAAGWVVESPLCRRALARRACVVHIRVPVATLLPRIGAGAHRRSVSAEDVAELDRRRGPLFDQVADVVVDGRLPVTDVAAAALAEFQSRCLMESWTR